MLIEVQLQNFADKGTSELTKVIVVLRAELDVRSTERARLDHTLGQELPGLVLKVPRSSAKWERRSRVRPRWEAVARRPQEDKADLAFGRRRSFPERAPPRDGQEVPSRASEVVKP
jgi:hypothetical protein